MTPSPQRAAHTSSTDSAASALLTGCCIVSPETLGPFANGGVGTAAYRLAQLLAREGETVTILFTGRVTREDRGQWEKELYSDRAIGLIVLDEWTHPCQPADIIEPSPNDPDSRQALGVHAFLQQQAFSIVYFQEYMGHGLRAVQAKATGLEFKQTIFVTWCHSSQLWSMRGNNRHIATRNDLIKEAHERICVRQSEIVATPSMYMAEWVQNEWDLPSPQFLPYWYTPPKGTHSTARKQRAFRGFNHLIFFGRLEKRKGLDLLLNALRSSNILPREIKQVSFLGRQIKIDNRMSGELISESLEGLGLPFQIVDNLDTDEAIDWLQSQKHALAISPSLLDNFPFVLVELLAIGIPFLSTRVGGIPEIVGEANADEILMEPTVRSIREKLEEVFSRQLLTIDYDSGFDTAAAAKTILSFHRSLVDRPVKAKTTNPKQVSDILIIGANDTGSIRTSLKSLKGLYSTISAILPIEAKEALLNETKALLHQETQKEDGSVGTILRADCAQSLEGSPSLPLLVVRAGESLLSGGQATLTTALQTSRAQCACGYVRRPMLEAGASGQHFEHRPLGSAIDIAFLEEEAALTTPLLIAPEATGLFLETLRAHNGQLRTALVEFAILAKQSAPPRKEAIAVVPQRIAEGCPQEPFNQTDRSQLTQLYVRYRDAVKPELLFPLAYPGLLKSRNASALVDFSHDEGPYPFLSQIGDKPLINYLESSSKDSAIKRIVSRISPRIPYWIQENTNLFLYGAGEHSKVILSLFPVLWPRVKGFIDTYRSELFLGKPCLKPSKIELPKNAVILYSSREYETDMYRAVKHIEAEHVLIYTQSPSPQVARFDCSNTA